ncbi:MAG: hypothetical protein IPL61_26615 [Myxococcales bacterium]|nr:hypothetical protein [Myxococcales bacterium]
MSRCLAWSDRPLAEVLVEREAQAVKLVELDGAVAEAVQRLKDAGFTSGNLKPVVVARINPLRFVRAKPGQPVRGDLDQVIAKMLAGARGFDASKVKEADIAAAAAMGGGSDE